MANQVFCLSIETDAGTYQHGFHLGSDERVARNIAEETLKHARPKIGTRIVTVALMRDHRIFDVYGGTWCNADAEAAFAEGE